jgi:hypothetical protein
MTSRDAWLAGPFSATDKLSEVRRELKMRQHVYDRMLHENKIARQDAIWQMNVMKAIEADYIELAKKEQLL